MLAAAGVVSAQVTATPSPAQSPQPSAAPSHSSPASAGPAAPVVPGITATTDPDKVVLNIDGDKMTARQFDEMIKAFPPQIQQAANGPQRHQFIEQYVQLKLAAKEAEKRNLESKPEVKQQLSIQHDNVLAQALYQDLSANIKVSDAEIQKYYDDHKKDYETAKAHHVLIAFKGSPVTPKDKKELTDAEALAKAQAVQKRLLAGEDIATVAKEVSDDTSSPTGDLGTFSHGQMVPAFDAAVFSLPIGKVSDPVKTNFGYHVIRVDSRESKPLSEVRAQIEPKVRQEMAKKEMDDLRSKNTVMIDDAFFKPAGPSGGPTK